MKNTNNSKYWQECREIGSLTHFQWDIGFARSLRHYQNQLESL